MREIDFDYPKIISKGNPMPIYGFGDTHCGNEGFNEKLLKKDINKCKKEDAYWIHMGDWTEGILSSDKRADVRAAEAALIIKHYKKMRDMFGPIKGKCLGIIAGNHDETISCKMGDLVKELIADELNVPYLGYMGRINLRFKHSEKTKQTQHIFSILLHHGRGGGRKVGRKIDNLIDMSSLGPANMYMMGHFHIYASHVDCDLAGNLRYYIATPSYMDAYAKGDTNYVKRGAYTRQPTGCVRIELYRKGDNIEAKVEPLFGR